MTGVSGQIGRILTLTLQYSREKGLHLKGVVDHIAYTAWPDRRAQHTTSVSKEDVGQRVECEITEVTRYDGINGYCAVYVRVLRWVPRYER